MEMDPQFSGCIMIQFNYCNWFRATIMTNLTYTLPKTNSSHLEMDGWNTFSFPFGAFRPIFRGKLLFVLGSVVKVTRRPLITAQLFWYLETDDEPLSIHHSITIPSRCLATLRSLGLKVKLLLGPTCKIPRSTQRSC